MGRKGASGMYMIILSLILGVLVLVISLVFNEAIFDKDGDREVCAQSIQVRASLPSAKVWGTNIDILKLKEEYPIKCKTNVVEIDEGDVRDGEVEAAQRKIAEAMAECWYLYGKGDYSVFPGKLSSLSDCVPCARIHLTEDAKKELGDKKISIKTALDLSMKEGFTYYNYLQNSGDKFSAFKFGNTVSFDQGGEKFLVGKDDSLEEVASEVSLFINDDGELKRFNDKDLQNELEDVVLGLENIASAVKGVGVKVHSTLTTDENVLNVNNGLEKGEVVKMTGVWDLEKVLDKIKFKGSGNLIVEGKLVSDVRRNSLLPFGGVSDGFVLSFNGASVDERISVGESMTGGEIVVGCGSDIVNLGKEMRGGRIVVSGSEVKNLGESMIGGEIIVLSGSKVENLFAGQHESSDLKVKVESGAMIKCSDDGYREITSEEDLKGCSGVYGIVEFVSEFSFEKSFSCYDDSGFCNDKDYKEKCIAFEEYGKTLGDDVSFVLDEYLLGPWRVDLSLPAAEKVEDYFGVGSIVLKSRAGGDFEIYSAKKVVLPEFLDSEKGDLVISYGSFSVGGNEKFGDYVPYLFYFQTGQVGVFDELSSSFVGENWYSNVRYNDFCSAWDGVPA